MAWILGLGAEAQVIDPPDLREAVVAALELVADRHQARRRPHAAAHRRPPGLAPRRPPPRPAAAGAAAARARSRPSGWSPRSASPASWR